MYIRSTALNMTDVTESVSELNIRASNTFYQTLTGSRQKQLLNLENMHLYKQGHRLEISVSH